MTLFLDTLRAMLAPRRLLPTALLSASLLWAQAYFSRLSWAVGLGALLLVVFFLVGPWSWRYAVGGEVPLRRAPWRVLPYLVASVVPVALAVALPQIWSLGTTFLTVGANGAVIVALFLVGGWGLGRDIEQELGLARAEAAARAAAEEAERAQLLALRAHLDPHFLFNTLNAIAEWCREDGATAEAAVLRLSALLREVMAGVMLPAWPLARELALVRDLWDLHGVRDPERFAYQWRVPAELPVADLPPLLLLPLAENAVKHGPAAGHDGLLKLEVREGPGEVIIEISNPGPLGPHRQGGEGVEMVRRAGWSWPGPHAPAAPASPSTRPSPTLRASSPPCACLLGLGAPENPT